MFAGTIGKWNPKGYAFITRDDGGPNLFVHANALDGPDTDTGVYGRRVSFDIGTRHDGKLYATA
jgi:cold shock CspA family protein